MLCQSLHSASPTRGADGLKCAAASEASSPPELGSCLRPPCISVISACNPRPAFSESRSFVKLVPMYSVVPVVCYFPLRFKGSVSVSRKGSVSNDCLSSHCSREAQERWVPPVLSAVAPGLGPSSATVCRGSGLLSREDTTPDLLVRKESAVFIFFRKKTFRRFFFFFLKKLFRLEGI